MKRMGRKNRPFYRLCAIDQRSPRDGRVLEELGHYDPMCRETDARAILKGERIKYWLSVGAQPSDNVSVLIKKYGSEGTHLEQQAAAIGRLGRTPIKQPVPASAS
jgi:small subunit ribosomal protein S16